MSFSHKFFIILAICDEKCKRNDVYDRFIPKKEVVNLTSHYVKLKKYLRWVFWFKVPTDLRHQLYVFPIPFDKIFYELATALSHGERASTCQKPLIKFNRLEPLWSLTHA